MGTLLYNTLEWAAHVSSSIKADKLSVGVFYEKVLPSAETQQNVLSLSMKK